MTIAHLRRAHMRFAHVRFARRQFLRLAAGAAALPAVSRLARAESYPSRPVRVIVGYPAGSGPDLIARLVGQRLSERLAQQFVVENRPGAGSNIATETVVRSPPDGYTLLMVTATNAINATLYDKLNFDFLRDIAPVAGIGRTPIVMVVNPQFPAETVPDFIAYAKANPGKINFASAGNGTVSHMAGELFQMMAGLSMTHVPYRSSYMADLLGAQVQVAFTTIPSAIEYIRTAKLRALGVGSAARSDSLPDVPTIADCVPGYEVSGWYGAGLPKNSPAESVENLNAEINAAVADPAIERRLVGLGAEAMPMTQTEFGIFISGEIEKWAKVIKFANIKAA